MDVRDHSIYFDDYNTWDMWHLVPSGRPTPTIPEVRTNYVTIPGRSGSLDLSTALTGSPIYEDRELEADFILVDQLMNWMDVYHDIVNKLHGQRMKIRLVDDPDWYYIGRVMVSDFASNSDYSSISITCQLEPYKYSDTPWEDYLKLYKADMPTITTNGVQYYQITVVMGTPREETGSIKNANQILPGGSIICTKDSPVKSKTTSAFFATVIGNFHIEGSYVSPPYINMWNSNSPFGTTILESNELYNHRSSDGLMYGNPTGTYNNTTTIRTLKSEADSWFTAESYIEIKMSLSERCL